MITFERLQGQGDDYTTRCLLDYPYFKKYYALIAIDLTKLQKLQSWTKYVRQTLVSMWNSAIQENFNFFFSAVFC